MKITFKVLLYLALTSMTCEGSFATWNGTHWGMQPSDVQQATGAKAKKIKPSTKDRNGLNKIGNSGFFEENGNRYSATYYYDDRGLKSVALTSSTLKCANIFDFLTKKYGRHIRHSNQTILHLFIWHHGAEENRIRFLVIGNGQSCSTHIERLSDYEVIDKSSVN